MGDVVAKTESPGPATFWGKFRGVGKALFAAVVALAGAVTAIAAALYIVAPELKPREKLGAELDRIAVAQGVSYDQYLSDQGREPQPGESVPTEPGVAVLVHAKLFGFEDRSYAVTVVAYDAETLTAIHPKQEGEFESTCEGESPKADEDAVAWRCWMIAPPVGAKYFVRAELYDHGPIKDLKPGTVDSGDLLDFLDSPEVASAHAEK
jgi:hypothetical protein